MGNSIYFEGSETYFADCYGNSCESDESDLTQALWVSQR